MTHDPERAMLMYAQLASVAARKQQLIGRDRFLVLTGIAATHAGWPAVAERSAQLIAGNAPRHMITRYSSFADALRDEAFTQFARQTERFCSPERAEHLLSQMAIDVPQSAPQQTPGELALSMLASL